MRAQDMNEIEVRTRPRSVTPEPRPPPQTPPPRPVRPIRYPRPLNTRIRYFRYLRPIRYPRPLNTRIRYLMDDDDEEGEVVENTGFLRYGNTRILTRGSILVTKLAKIEKTECPICFEFDSNSQLGCCHTFCKTCIFKHASNKIDSCCPMCRDPIKKIAVLYEDFENIVFPNNHFVKLSETSENNIKFHYVEYVIYLIFHYYYLLLYLIIIIILLHLLTFQTPIFTK